MYPKWNIKALSQVLMQVVSRGKLSPLARKVASMGRNTAKNMMVSECVEKYSLLLESILGLPSEVALPKNVSEIPLNLKEKWQWTLFDSVSNTPGVDTKLRSYDFLDTFEERWNRTQVERSVPVTVSDDSFMYRIWQDEKESVISNARRRREEEEVTRVGIGPRFISMYFLKDSLVTIMSLAY